MEEITSAFEVKEENIENEPVAKKRKVMPQCEQCNSDISKYTCPKCSFKTCSVKCVQQHKVDNNVSLARAHCEISEWMESIGKFFAPVKDRAE